jgi:hypothetical protein
VGGKSPSIDVKVAGAKLEWFRRHPSAAQGPLNWVASSGVKGLDSITVKLSAARTSPHKYTVRLYFVEPDGLKPGQRLFDVVVQGQEMLKGFDIAKESGGPMRALVREFKGVAAAEELVVPFRPTPGAQVEAAVLCGVEIIAE